MHVAFWLLRSLFLIIFRAKIYLSVFCIQRNENQSIYSQNLNIKSFLHNKNSICSGYRYNCACILCSAQLQLQIHAMLRNLSDCAINFSTICVYCYVNRQYNFTALQQNNYGIPILYKLRICFNWSQLIHELKQVLL